MKNHNDSTVQLEVSDWGMITNPKTGIKETVKKFKFTNKNRTEINIISYGVIITNINVPDKHGNIQDVALGFDNIEGYLRKDNPYFGAAIGRVANRIGNGVINVHGQKITVSKNHQEKHQLHGGFIGFDKYNWNSYVNGKKVVFSLLSQDGDEGYPGDLITTCTASLDDDNRFTLEFKACCTKPTPVNLTNHSYFNLAGHDTGHKEIYNHTISINADNITETDHDSIPTGKLLKVAGTPYDLRIPQQLGPAIANLSTFGFDDNFCVMQASEQTVTFIGRAVHEKTGRVLEVYSDQPGVQLYTANYMPDASDEIHPEGKKKLMSPNKTDSIHGKQGALYQKHGAFCLETQKFPDGTNHVKFPDTILNPSDTYKHVVVYKFGILE